jgi:glycosyltransferase involved in cell wall biosynthesis
MIRQKKILVLVSNDLVTDQRVFRICNSMHTANFKVELWGRCRTNSMNLPAWPWKSKRFNLLIETGPFFYLFLTITFFFKLLFSKFDVVYANDLDTLLPAYLICKLKGKELIYDTHEYFTGVPELADRPRVRAVWETIESYIFPKLKNVFTVNDSIAELYNTKYHLKPLVMRNIPIAEKIDLHSSRLELGLPTHQFLIILQGNGINIQRGGEEAVEMMKYLEGCCLVIVGAGDVIPILKNMVKKENLGNKVLFFPRMTYNQLLQYTLNCDLGLSLDKPTNINYQLSLPNKLFDYIRAEIPVLASNLVEVRNIVTQYQVGEIVTSYEPEYLALKINELKNNKVLLETYKSNCKKAKHQLTWENESLTLINLLTYLN